MSTRGFVVVPASASCPSCGHRGDTLDFADLAPADKVRVTDDGCWEYSVADRSHGYGSARRSSLHRLSYERHVGPIPDGHEVHHRCRNRVCFNPEHLVALSPAEHADAHRPEFCGRGHPLSDAYARRDGKGRNCRACRSIRKKAQREAKEVNGV